MIGRPSAANPPSAPDSTFATAPTASHSQPKRPATVSKSARFSVSSFSRCSVDRKSAGPAGGGSGAGGGGGVAGGRGGGGERGGGGGDAGRLPKISRNRASKKPIVFPACVPGASGKPPEIVPHRRRTIDERPQNGKADWTDFAT